VAAAILLMADSARAQIDLTLKDSFYEAEDIRVPNVSFRNGDKDVAFSPPHGWTLSGGGQKLTLTPRDKIQAGATITVLATREASPAATAENLKHYTKIASGLLPREASKIEVMEAAVCPLRISGRFMVEVTMAYVFFGQPFRMNVLFMPREKEELRFQIVARTSDYADLFQAFRSSLYSIEGL
jgi:hypothetical protein